MIKIIYVLLISLMLYGVFDLICEFFFILTNDDFISTILTFFSFVSLFVE